jgi:putative Holliday junction resolvase
VVRALGIDLGSRRIGVAVSDTTGTLASPLEVVERCGDELGDHRRLGEIVAEYEAEVVVVGLPLSLDGSEGPAAVGYRAEAERLDDHLSVPVETYDERFTTVTAEQQLRDAGVRGPARREVIDKVAAAVLLQAWLDARDLPPWPPGER